MQLINRFKNELHKTQLFDFTDKILIGVSGGRDSMCLTHILKECGYNIAIAHCNFSLRGDESDADEQLVKEYALTNSITLHSVKFNTKEEAHQNGESIQIAARRLRYDWFDNLCSKYNYDVVAIAHNSDDSAETFFINLVRGTGLKGLRGIRSQRDNIVRPLIFASRAEITDFCVQNSIKYRDDSSNSSDKYLRNKIRHKIMPTFVELNNDFKTTMLETTQNVSNSHDLLDFFISNIEKQSIITENNQKIISLDLINTTPNPAYTLFEVIRKWGFTHKQCKGITTANSQQKSGIQFFSKEYTILLNRGNLLLDKTSEKHSENEESEALLNIGSVLNYGNYTINAEILDISSFSSFKTPSNVALFDLEKLSMPLTIRKHLNGDEFSPFGMKGTKKVSDYMVDKKLSAYEKEEVLIFTNNDIIAWVAPHRTSNKFSITKTTKSVLRIIIEEKSLL